MKKYDGGELKIIKEIWDVLEDRKALIKTLEDFKRFLDEVTRKEDFKKGDKPRFNWINSFTSFEDIVGFI
ncbi:hypothetical protein C8E03_101331 [Lachnotalea glycerini]|uniref:Uncharacterized protein n=1 Tax=Lachnotalea glycerini TaxID=1763509 RepID=A0A318ERW3_9FIRM|nr:hypothetical protein [Lachnotalea glycerini]PXV95701.1 hypothetical protein C8E03_101331 [Lachnotalea glycerini]